MSSDATLITDYDAGPARVRQAIAGMTREQMLARPIEGKWSTQEVVIHIVDGDLAFAHRLKRIIAEEKPAYDAWSENDYIRTLHYADQSVDDALAILEAMHRQLSRVFKALPAGWLDRVGIHPERGPQTAREVLGYANWHLTHHLEFVEAKKARLGIR